MWQQCNLMRESNTYIMQCTHTHACWRAHTHASERSRYSSGFFSEWIVMNYWNDLFMTILWIYILVDLPPTPPHKVPEVGKNVTPHIVSVITAMAPRGIHFMHGTVVKQRNRRRDSSGLRAGWSWVRVAAGTGNFSLHHSVQTGSGAHLASYTVGTRDSFAGGKEAGAWSWPLTCI
jgi:hypothetical protein